MNLRHTTQFPQSKLLWGKNLITPHLQKMEMVSSLCYAIFSIFNETYAHEFGEMRMKISEKLPWIHFQCFVFGCLIENMWLCGCCLRKIDFFYFSREVNSMFAIRAVLWGIVEWLEGTRGRVSARGGPQGTRQARTYCPCSELGFFTLVGRVKKFMKFDKSARGRVLIVLKMLSGRVFRQNFPAGRFFVFAVSVAILAMFWSKGTRKFCEFSGLFGFTFYKSFTVFVAGEHN